MDRITSEQRSRNMSAVRGSRNKTTEIRFIKILMSAGIIGWRRNIKMFGRPDFVFRRLKVAVFVDGCFWHGCGKHGSIPETNKFFWETKINANMIRDKKVTVYYKSRGWISVRIWEHDVKNNSAKFISFVRLMRRLFDELKSP